MKDKTITKDKLIKKECRECKEILVEEIKKARADERKKVLKEIEDMKEYGCGYLFIKKVDLIKTLKLKL